MKSALLGERAFVEQYRRAVEESLTSRTDKSARLGARFASILKSLCTIGAGLCRGKELKDFLMNCVDQVVQPLCRVSLSNEELTYFFDEIVDNFSVPTSASSSAVADQLQLKNVFQRHVEVIKHICLLIYPKYLKQYSQWTRWLK